MALINSKIGINPAWSLKLNCIIWTPDTYDKSKKYPLLIFGHGTGEAGTDINTLYKEGLPAALKAGFVPPFDVIICCPQAQSYGVKPEWLPQIVVEMQANYSIDVTRKALTGLSAGGLMCWGSQLNISQVLADTFVAIVVLSGATQDAPLTNIAWWKTSKVPVWAIVGAQDISYVNKNQEYVDAVNAQVPGLAKFSSRPGIGHERWIEIYNGTFTENGQTMWDYLKPYLVAPVVAPPVVVPPVTPPIVDPITDVTITYASGKKESVRNLTIQLAVGQTISIS